MGKEGQLTALAIWKYVFVKPHPTLFHPFNPRQA